MDRKLLTLAYIQKEGRILLGMKRRGFGTGKWNDFGGKVHVGETFAVAAAREMQEEAGVTPIGLREVGQLDFEFEGNPLILETRVFVTSEYESEPQETEEMSPKWHRLDEIPYANM
jgi:8-oxo-dGTP pyrophosphatase MutT (NUDIX family)